MLNNYTFKEEFDVNLTLTYENDKWEEWHVMREFLSNALDSAQNDTNKIRITISNNFFNISDSGPGYPIVYAKRIGASTKKGDESSIGMFGEGTKLAILTCIRKGINIMLASQDWLIVPKIKECEGQEVLMYDVYEGEPIKGSMVAIEATGNVQAIIKNLSDYFLFYYKDKCLHGDPFSGIYPQKNNISKLYNKGVYIKDIDALFSYGISIERLNRDRDLISYIDICYKVRDIGEHVQDIYLIKQLIQASAGENRKNSNLVEFYLSLNPTYRHLWKQAFHELYGENAILSTNDIAAREAESLGFKVIKLNHETKLTLMACGIQEDINCLAEDYEFEWSKDLNPLEKENMDKLCLYAKVAGLELPDSIKIYAEKSCNAILLSGMKTYYQEVEMSEVVNFNPHIVHEETVGKRTAATASIQMYEGPYNIPTAKIREHMKSDSSFLLNKAVAPVKDQLLEKVLQKITSFK